MIILFGSCRKADKINHYLPSKVTAKELIKNGFYKYSYTDTIEDRDKIDDTIKHIVRYDMYSNVKPEKNNSGEIYPMQLGHFYREDSIKKKKNIEYRKSHLNNRIITYVFRNNLLFYKSLIAYSIDRSQKNTAELTSKEKIISYYKTLNIPIKPIYKTDSLRDKYPRRFLIGNYKTFIDYSSDEQEYHELFVNYINGDIYGNILDDWYSGRMSNSRYYL
ncbi:hypothetical protein CLU99_2263 [Flavobacterium sp. 2]|nr:hypothetical protein CLU99_2263 [Flavobacterium sp. 2]